MSGFTSASLKSCWNTPGVIDLLVISWSNGAINFKMSLRSDVGMGSRSQCFVGDFTIVLIISFSETLLNSVSWTSVSEHSWSSIGLISPAFSRSDIVLNGFSHMSMILLVKCSLNSSASCCGKLVSGSGETLVQNRSPLQML